MEKPRFFFSNEFTKYKEIFKQFEIKTCDFKKGNVIYSTYTGTNICLYIESGLIGYSLTSETGIQKNLFYNGEDSIFPSYHSTKTYAINEIAYAMTDVHGFMFTQQSLRKIMIEHSEISFKILDIYMEMFNYLLYDSISQCSNQAYTRTCNFLVLYYEYLKKHHKQYSPIFITLDELAHFVGVSRVQISSIFKELRNEKLISNRRGKIEILDYPSLKMRCSVETNL